jgi:hypothetical protein
VSGLQAAASPAPGPSLAPGRNWILFFLAVGLGARLVRYLLSFPLWDDEAFLCTSLIDRGYLGLLETLDCHQVAPFLFLWIELSVTRLLGFNELALRLFPVACGLAALVLFRRMAGRLLTGSAEVVAIALFCVSYPCIRLFAEAKQYSSDVFASIALMTLALAWLRRPEKARLLWLLVALTPVAIFLSYPAVFVLGGVSLMVLAVLRTRARRRDWIAWVALNLVLVASFAVMLQISSSQSSAELDYMTSTWDDSFPPAVTQPLRFLAWVLDVHTGDMLAYPMRGRVGVLAALLCGAGIVAFVRARRWNRLVLFLTPFLLHFVAACLHRYPYGDSMKFTFYMAPVICVLAGRGAAQWLAFRPRRCAARSKVLTGFLVILGIIGAGSIVRDVAHPYKTLSDLRNRAFARWFWFNAEFQGESACLTTDFGVEVMPELFIRLNWAAEYFCNQKIYSPRHARGEPLQLERVSADWPLRVAMYRPGKLSFDQAALDAWLEEMNGRLQLVARDSMPVPRYAKNERRLVTVDYLETFKFVPR